MKTPVADEPEALTPVRGGKLRAVAILPKGLGQQAGAAMFGGAKPEIVLHFDPSQASVLAVVRGLLAQTLMQEVSRSTFSPEGLDRMRRDVSHAPMPASQRADFTRMFDAIQAVHHADAGASSASAAPPRARRMPPQA